jgi:hypothetical protein
MVPGSLHIAAQPAGVVATVRNFTATNIATSSSTASASDLESGILSTSECKKDMQS